MKDGTSPQPFGVRLRQGRAWPIVRRVARPIRSRARAVIAVGASWRRHLRAATAHGLRRMAGRARREAHAHPGVTDATLRPARRVVGGLGRRLRSATRRPPDAPPARAYFDAAWYRAAVPDSGGDAWAHYCRFGGERGIGPNAVWDVTGYRYDHPDTAEFGGDVLAHWIARGRAAGATPHPLFDPAWYRRTHASVGRSEPYLHYLRHGRAAGLATSAAVEAGVAIADATLALPEPAAGMDPAVTIVVPAYRSWMLTWRCLFAVATRTPASLRARVLLVDDDPDHPIAPLLAGTPGLERAVNPVNLGFLRSCNAAVARTRGDLVVLLNSDTVVQPGWLDALVGAATDDPGAGMIGCALLEPGGRLQESGVIMESDGWGVPFGRGEDPGGSAYRYRREVDAVTAACVLVRRAAWDAVGGFDEAYAPAFFEEYDLAYRLRAAGWRVLVEPASRVIHEGSASYGTAERDHRARINHERFAQRFAAELAVAPWVGSDRFLSRQRGPQGGTILVIDDRVPEPDRNAGSLTLRLFLDLLVAEGLRVVYLPADGLDRPAADPLRAAGIEVLVGTDPDAWLDAHGRHLDWVLLARPLVADRFLPALRRWTTARLVYYTHDLHHLRERRRAAVTGDARAHTDARYLEEVEGAVLRSVDVVLTPSAAEVEPIRALAPGVDVRTITAWPYPPGQLPAPAGPPLGERRGILFVGAFEHLPNVDAALALVRDVMPQVWAELPATPVVLVGADPPAEVRALADDRVTVAGWVADLDACYASARLTLNPLRYGAGVKGKIVSSLAAGVPVVTTTIGDEGLGLRQGEEGFVADAPEELARHALALLRDPALAERVAVGGRRLVAERFSAERGRAELLGALGPPRLTR